MKFILVFLMSIISTLALASESTEQIKKKLLKEESKVKDVYYAENNDIWMIGVLTDGTPRYGYAEYVCSVLSDFHVIRQKTSVRIVDIVQVKNGKSPRAASLGRVDCNSYEHFTP